MSKQVFNEQENKELVIVDANGRDKEWYCPLISLEELPDGSLSVNNTFYDYHIDKSEFSTYRIQDCTCRGQND